MSERAAMKTRAVRGSQAGFTLIELMISVAVMMIVSASVMTGVDNLTKVNGMVSNRTEMHAGVRNATELLQQEVGQAGRVTLPAAVVLSAPSVAGTSTFAVNSVAGMFQFEQLIVDTGANAETVRVTAINAATLVVTIDTTSPWGVFVSTHALNAPVSVLGGFSSGVVPTNMVNGSTASVLKIYGDINGDGNMVYVEYTCDTGAGNLYRNSMAWNVAVKPPVTVSSTLLNNILVNPGGTACFTYQQKTVNGNTYVVDVAITLTVQTPNKDPITGLYQTESKALLNVAPRNVFAVFQQASQGINDRVQPMPATVTNLLP
jgi:prepilin-type N-terminal cleavage/methylation domain-containing protein